MRSDSGSPRLSMISHDGYIRDKATVVGLIRVCRHLEIKQRKDMRRKKMRRRILAGVLAATLMLTTWGGEH